MKNSSSTSFPLLDLPEAVILRICGYLARCPIFSDADRPYRELPYDLLSLAATCHSCRALVKSTCDSLTFDAYSSWQPVVSWLRFASPQLRLFRISPLPTQIDFPLRPHQLLPPATILTSLHFSSFPLRHLDLSGLNLFHDHDAYLLAPVLSNLRHTLTSLVLLDARSAFRSVVQAVVQAKLHNLTSFSYLSLRSECRQEIIDILSSFQTPQVCNESNTTPTTDENSSHITLLHESNSKSEHFSERATTVFSPFPSSSSSSSSSLTLSSSMTSKLTHLHLHVQESSIPEGSCLSLQQKSFPIDMCPNVMNFTFESEFESPQVVPEHFIHMFQSLRILTLKNLMLDQFVMDSIITQLPKLKEIQLDGCLVLHDEETMLHEKSEPFLQVINMCKPKLTSLWLPARYFSSCELYELIEKSPNNLKSLALTIAQSSLCMLPKLCKKFEHTLENFRISILADDGTISSIPIHLQEYLVKSIKHLKSLTSLHFMSVYLKMDLVCEMLKHLNNQLNTFFVEINPNDNCDNQFNDTINLLQAVHQYCHGLNFFCIEHETPNELIHDCEKAKQLKQCVENVLQSARFLNSTNLRSLLSVWICQDQESNSSMVDNVAVDDRLATV